ncbi:long-chain fatty acid--CoA ligase [Endozoicomonas sp. SCSIO W0465]|uniref:long-chain-fatty-acid--CoA ligase n=1 Tax=Endozoicomonas sp. SCSIO W0465 TaxID=2918516 RepID=UPI002075233B|nr:long-chain fatty acid--CoA ligase [Endozoicomonas sp. SCSIO W0465]USE36929.1 long-chain fatty acid--CoA ligase [Endozoicomonas sp. SCSIO W0465]USE38755.1 long-chain fatty acid--CoA ligase [Endozoicomonas sp. SCSIO W0465]
MSNLADFLYRSAAVYPDKVAVVYGDLQISYQALKEAAASIGKGLQQQGIKPGDRVAMSCPNIPQFLMVYYGILSAGAVVVPLNILLKPKEIAYHLTDSQAVAFLCFEGSSELPLGQFGLEAFQQVSHCEHFFVITADPEKEVWKGQSTLSVLLSAGSLKMPQDKTADDTATIIYTSGTTGRPKGAELTHHNLSMNALILTSMLATDVSDTHLVVLPLFHIFAQTVHMLHAVASASTMVLMARFEATKTLEMLVQEKISFFAGVPTMYIALNGAEAELTEADRHIISDRLRLCISGGGPMPVEVMKTFEGNFKVAILEGYGLSETSPVACFNTLDQERIAGSIGRPVPGVALKVVGNEGQSLSFGQDGELAIRGHNVMKGYFNKPEQTAEVMKDGWFYTGDIARRDEAGNYYIVDRKKDLIIRGGFNVYPREVEEVLLAHPDIIQAAVIGVPDDYYVEEILACLILHEGCELSPELFKTWARQQLGDYKYPRYVRIFQEFPLSATGKILKRELRDMLRKEGLRK